MAHPSAAPDLRRWRCLIVIVGLLVTMLAGRAQADVAATNAVKDAPPASTPGAVVTATLPAGTLAHAMPPAAPPSRPLPDKSGWVTIFADDFEGTFPGPWQLANQGAATGWGRWTCWSGDTPTHSVGCAAGGEFPIGCGQNYPDNMNSWLVYGPFSLADPSYTAAELRFNFTLNSEEGFDGLWVMASVNGTNFFGNTYSGQIAPRAETLDLAAVPDLGNLLGQAQVWIAFRFTSDSSITFPEGAQVDDVLIRAAVPAVNQPPQVTVTAPTGGETWPAGAQRTITYTATDPDSGPSPLTIAIDFSSDGGAAWQPVASGLTSTGSYAWTVPAVPTTQARIRVRASDGADEGQGVSAGNFTIVVPEVGENTLAVGTGAGAAGASVTVALGLVNENAVKGLQADLLYDPAVATLAGFAAAGRGTGMTAAMNVVSAGRARIVLYHDGASAIAPGDGQIAGLVFELDGTAGAQSAVTLQEVILSDPMGLELAVDVTAGSLAVTAAEGAPVLQIAVLHNPGRVRTLQILVNVTDGSGNPPTVTAGGANVSMTALGGGRYLGTFAAATGTAGLVITASDTNANGQGTAQVNLEF
jgi:hypothetical protein